MIEILQLFIDGGFSVFVVSEQYKDKYIQQFRDERDECVILINKELKYRICVSKFDERVILTNARIKGII